jgi:hypothetical protein
VRDYALAGPYKQLKNYKPQDWGGIVDGDSGVLTRPAMARHWKRRWQSCRRRLS